MNRYRIVEIDFRASHVTAKDYESAIASTPVAQSVFTREAVLDTHPYHRFVIGDVVRLVDGGEPSYFVVRDYAPNGEMYLQGFDESFSQDDLDWVGFDKQYVQDERSWREI